MPQQLILIVGSSGVGKSTLAKALQEEFLPRQWLRFSPDAIFESFPASVVRRVNTLNEHTAINWRSISSGAYACGQVLLEQGHSLIFDTVVMTPSGADQLKTAFGSFDPLIVELTADWSTIKTRTLARSDRTLEEAEHGYRNCRGHITPDLVYDTTDFRPEQIASEIAMHVRSSPSAA
jgi:chloramphenicol 3-O phosphotransferase